MKRVDVEASRPGDPFNKLPPEVTEELLRDALLQLGWTINPRSKAFLISPDGRYQLYLAIKETS